jgi:hypothetical protein
MSAQPTYSFNCESCGRIFEVANPRPDQVPSAIRIVVHDSPTPRFEIVDMHCPHCSAYVGLEFEYRQHACEHDTPTPDPRGGKPPRVCRE